MLPLPRNVGRGRLLPQPGVSEQSENMSFITLYVCCTSSSLLNIYGDLPQMVCIVSKSRSLAWHREAGLYNLCWSLLTLKFNFNIHDHDHDHDMLHSFLDTIRAALPSHIFPSGPMPTFILVTSETHRLHTPPEHSHSATEEGASTMHLTREHPTSVATPPSKANTDRLYRKFSLATVQHGAHTSHNLGIRRRSACLRAGLQHRATLGAAVSQC